MQIAPVPFAQPVADYIAAFHAHDGLARERMGPSAATFDSARAAILARHCPDGLVRLEVGATLIWASRAPWPHASETSFEGGRVGAHNRASGPPRSHHLDAR